MITKQLIVPLALLALLMILAPIKSALGAANGEFVTATKDWACSELIE